MATDSEIKMKGFNILKKELVSELDGIIYEPENYFVNYFHCLEDKN